MASANLLTDDPQVKAALKALQKQSPVGHTQVKPLVTSAGLPFDAGLAAQRDDLVAKLNNQDLAAQQQSQNNTIDAMSSARGLMQAEPGIERNLLNRAAARGMAFSSGYGMQVGQAKDQFANSLADLMRKYAASQSGIRTSTEGNRLNTQYLLDRLMQQQAMNVSSKSMKDALAVAAAKVYGG